MAKRITITPQQFAEKQARNLINSTEDIKRGVEAVDVCPTHLTDSQLQKMQNNFVEAMTSGKTKRRMHAVTLAEWKNATITKGIGRIAAGITAAKSKVEAFASELLTYEQAGLDKITNMPAVTFEDSVNRMVAWSRHMKDFKRSA